MQNKESILSNVERHNFKIKKHFGQCFLSDSSIVRKIVESSNIDNNVGVLEIGPGTGALTEELVKNAGFVVAYEIDSEVIPILKENLHKYNNFEVINKDILKADPSEIVNDKRLSISIANLPYYITSPIIELYLDKLTNIKKGIFMVQKEVADRICADVGTKDYNAFSILVQYKAKVKKLIYVPRSSFTPSPNVDSMVIEIEKHDREHRANSDDFFTKVVQGSFKERRKTLVNNLSQTFNISKDAVKELLNGLEIREDARAETLSIDEFINLSNNLEELL